MPRQQHIPCAGLREFHWRLAPQFEQAFANRICRDENPPEFVAAVTHRGRWHQRVAGTMSLHAVGNDIASPASIANEAGTSSPQFRKPAALTG
ncbi:MAG: hypothetical protein Q8M18_03160 [Bradyrhizobium sp.]|nr:hypothetical protein [Bradyrhizobium sp.]